MAPHPESPHHHIIIFSTGICMTNTRASEITLKSGEINAFYAWLWRIGKTSSSRPKIVDAALYKKFLKSRKDHNIRNGYLASDE